MNDFLETVMGRRRDRIREEYGHLSPADRERLACCARPPRDFGAALRGRTDVAIIAEVKKASPSEGSIAPECEASKQALHYQRGGAAAVSVLTEPEFFGGSYADLSDVADAVDVPVLCKDFVVDPVQLFVARGHGADAVLLMVSVLGPLTRDFADISETLGMTALVEVASEEELAIALGARSGAIAFNSRDLRSLKVDPGGARGLITGARDYDITRVAASGIRTRGDVEAVASAGADAVLIGTTLMRAPFPEEMLDDLTGARKGVRP